MSCFRAISCKKKRFKFPAPSQPLGSGISDEADEELEEQEPARAKGKVDLISSYPKRFLKNTPEKRHFLCSTSFTPGGPEVAR